MNAKIGDWQRIADLGEGSFGVVSLWANRATKEEIVIKRCKRKELTAKQIERWYKEIEMLQNTKHPNIISYETLPSELEQGISNPSKLPLLPMEYCGKGNLRILLKQPRNSSGLQEQDIRDLLGDMGEALQYLHKLRIAHRDFKPENIVLKETADRKSGRLYKMIDLGFAKELDSTLSMVGTTEYAAPEILRAKNYTITVDYWSFGIVTFEIICGNNKYPFLPNMSPIERLQHIKNKKHTDICIYQNARSTHGYSKINQKCHISPWLKDALEKWLQNALEYDGSKRPKTLLQDLKLLLQKKVVTVFVVYTLTFYHYEIDEFVSISTLKTWISEDTKIDANDLILLTPKIYSCRADDNFLVDALTDDSTVFVFNKCALWSNSAKLPSPDFLTVDMKTIENLTALSSTIFCLLNEEKHFSALTRSLQLLNEYLKLSFHQARFQYERLRFVYWKLVTLFEFYNTVNSEKNDGDFKHLTSIVRRLSTKIEKLESRVDQVKSCEDAALSKVKKLSHALSKHTAGLENEIARAWSKIMCGKREEAGTAAFAVTSDTIRERQNILRSLKTETKVVQYSVEELGKLKEWMSCLHKNIDKTVASLRAFVILRSESAPSIPRANSENGKMDYEKLIQSSKTARMQLDDAINRCLSEFRTQRDFTEKFLQNVPLY